MVVSKLSSSYGQMIKTKIHGVSHKVGVFWEGQMSGLRKGSLSQCKHGDGCEGAHMGSRLARPMRVIKLASGSSSSMIRLSSRILPRFHKHVVGGATSERICR